MSLRSFLGGGGTRARTCPACEATVGSDATFCPFCYMVFRPEGAAALRQHLRGKRIPADVYLRRKMQSVDPDLGPVVSVPPEERPAAPPAAVPPPPPRPAPPVDARHQPPAASRPRPEPSTTEGAPPRRVGVRSLAEFEAPLPPPARTGDEVPALFTWMLEHDALIPNNLSRLEAIHAAVFSGGPAARLDYREHVLLSVLDDLALHEMREALQAHLDVLAGAYRRAAVSYGRGSDGKPDDLNGVLWRMASLASRIRLEAWLYQSRYGAPPPLLEPARRPRSTRK